MRTVKELLIGALRARGYDGVCSYDCGCWLDDFAPCGDADWLNCCPGHTGKDEEGNRVITIGESSNE